MNKLIPKFQTPWGPIMQSDNTRVNPIITETRIPNFTKLNQTKVGKALLHKVKTENPKFYNNKVKQEAHKAKPNSEIVTYKDAQDKTKTSSKVIGMSGADPVGEFVVANIAAAPIFKGLGKVAEYGLAKSGNNWARAKILSGEIDKSNIVANSLHPKPIVRTKVGDIEIDNPSLYYRQGSKEMADDFLETGIVDTDGAYSNPMFAQGHLWYGIPKRLTNRKNTEIVTKRGLKFDFGKRNEDVAKTHLLVSNPSTNMIGANHRAHAANTLIYKQRNSPISDSDLIKYEQNLGKDFVSKYQNAYYNGDLEDRMATIVTYPGGSRRIPAIKGAANKSNTQLYEYDPNYGYRLIQDQPSVYNASQRSIVQRVVRNPVQIKNEDYSNLTDQQWDDLYNQALKFKDVKELRTLRDLHFKIKAPNTKVVDNNGNLIEVYHGGDSNINVFKNRKDINPKITHSRRFNNNNTMGIYFTDNKNIANEYAFAYKNTKRPYSIYNAYLNLENVQPIKQKQFYGLQWIKNINKVFNKNYINYQDVKTSDVNKLNNRSIDGLKTDTWNKSNEYVFFDPNKVKSSDLITYDDNGKIIPISKRDNFNNPDIRYGMIPLIGTGLYRNYKENKQVSN